MGMFLPVIIIHLFFPFVLVCRWYTHVAVISLVVFCSIEVKYWLYTCMPGWVWLAGYGQLGIGWLGKAGWVLGGWVWPAGYWLAR